MSRICGLVEPGLSETVVDQRLERMCNAMAKGTPLRFSKWTAPGVGLAHFCRGSEDAGAQPAACDRSGDCLVLCGYLVSSGAGETDSSTLTIGKRTMDPADLLSWMGDSSLKGLPSLEGAFTFAHWDQSNRSLTLGSDRYGLRSPYIYHDPASGRLLFASDIRSISDSGVVDLEADWSSISVFLHMGFYLGEDTYWKRVRVLPFGHALVWQDGEVRLEGFWSPEEIEVDDQLSHESAVEGIAHHFRRSMERCHAAAPSPEIVFLSGGLDSRRIAAELRRLTDEFETFTTRGFDLSTGDQSLSKRVAERLGVDNTFVNLPRKDFLTEYWPRANELTGYETILHQWLLPLVDSLPERPMVNYDGLGGDIMINGAQQPLIHKLGGVNGLNAVAGDGLIDALTPPPLELCHLSNELRLRLRYEPVREAVRGEVRRFSNTVSPLTDFLLFNRTRRNVALAPLRLIDLRALNFFPYYDHAFFDFVASIPLQLKLSHPLRRESFGLLHPSLADIASTQYVGRERKTGSGDDDIRFFAQRRAFLLRNIRKHVLGRGWAFSRARAMGRSVMDVALRAIKPNHVSPVFTASLMVFYEWLDRYMPQGPRGTRR